MSRPEQPLLSCCRARALPSWDPAPGGGPVNLTPPALCSELQKPSLPDTARGSPVGKDSGPKAGQPAQGNARQALNSRVVQLPLGSPGLDSLQKPEV